MTTIRICVMTALLGAFGAGVPVDSRPAHAIEYPWCMTTSDRENGMIENCGFVSFDQCRQTASGMNGLCLQNPRYRPELQVPGPARRKANPRR